MSWDAPVEVIPGVGPRQGERLGRLGVRLLSDLIQLSPRRHEDRRTINPLAQAVDGAPVVFRAVVGEVESRRIRRGLYLVKVSVDDGSGADASLVFFNLPSLSGRFRGLAGSEILGYGTVRRRGKRVDVSAPEWEPVGDEDGAGGDFGKLVPVYPLVEGLTQQRMRSWVRWALERVLPSVPDAVPADLLDKRAWGGIADALVQFHFPDSPDQNARARRRLAYEELLGTLLLLERARAAARPGASCSMPGWRAAVDGFWSRFPYPPTGAQRRASEEIGADLGGTRPMQRLLQGDVGSGKTAVAMSAMVVAAQHGFQSALMAPTEILANQHLHSVRQLLEEMGFRVDLLTGSRPEAERRAVRERLASGECRVVVGTHALLQEAVAFRRLGLVVVDEQHRFGVMQRAMLTAKGEGTPPHVLVTTATPIPRTLTLSLYGDLEVSVLDELPPGRRPVRTHWKPRASRESVYAGVRTLLDEGRQAYVVCPVVEDDPDSGLKAATALHAELGAGVLSGYESVLVHGKLPEPVRRDAMERFRRGEVAVMVATTVIEVGVDVPNAAVMVVEDADRFGLAQLHQLRGRVGRGGHASFCVLLSDAPTDDARSRMEAMVSLADGFSIAEEDLRLRGAGEFFGVRQSGTPPLRYARLPEDIDLMEWARDDARELLRRDPDMERDAHRLLAEAVRRRELAVELQASA